MPSNIFSASLHLFVGLAICAALIVVTIEFAAGCGMDGRCVFISEDVQ
ncbi:MULTISPECIES: hypothetical protein [unclassified Chelatococcus]|nr:MULTISPECIES: hypothetical protein [unclassified Chelatococcus]MBS7701475.1 hypothetical protein [Chelatococcus sp. YT9]MBX3559205.1 hypothetical protein [Chelatococcus sp.]